VSTNLNQSRTSTRVSSVRLDDIFDVVHGLIPTAEREDHGFSFQGRLGTTHLHVGSADDRTTDGRRITDVVTIKTDITGFPMPSGETEVNLVALNMNAAMSALMVVPTGESTVLVSRLSAFEGDHEAWNLYTPMLAYAAVTQSETSCQTIVRTIASPEVDDTEGLPEAHPESPWDAADFDLAQDLLHHETKDLKDGHVLELPDLASTFGFQLDEASALLKNAHQDVREAAQKLRGLIKRTRSHPRRG
jgi:hypothetical protein